MEKRKPTAGERIDQMTDKISEVASGIGEKFEDTAEETKKVAGNVKNWWEKSEPEVITTTIIGIVLLIFALWALRAFLRGALLLLLGILFVSGYFTHLFEKFFEKSKKTLESAEKKINKETKNLKENLKEKTETLKEKIAETKAAKPAPTKKTPVKKTAPKKENKKS